MIELSLSQEAHVTIGLHQWLLPPKDHVGVRLQLLPTGELMAIDYHQQLPILLQKRDLEANGPITQVRKSKPSVNKK